MAIRDGVVAWLGSDDIGRALHPDATVVDLEGAFVAPAFVDSHVHLTATGLTETGLDLRAATSLPHLLILLAEHAAQHPDGVIWGHGWDESGWPERTAPTTADLDGVFGGRPAYLARVDVHSAVASTGLRRLVPGLTDSEGFSEQGPLTADAHHRVRAAARNLLSATQRRAAQRAALDLAARNGIVAVHECAGPEIGGLDDWTDLRATEHGVEIVGYWGEAVEDAASARELLDRTGAHGLAGDLFIDGALGSRTAWLNEPYLDGPGCSHSHGNTYLDTDAVTAHLLACTEAGITAGFHVIGDAAVAAVVEALDRTVAAFGAPAVARCGHRLEHVEMVGPEQARQLEAEEDDRLASRVEIGPPEQRQCDQREIEEQMQQRGRAARGRATIVGVGRASEAYFGVPARDLGVAEAALRDLVFHAGRCPSRFDAPLRRLL